MVELMARGINQEGAVPVLICCLTGWALWQLQDQVNQQYAEDECDRAPTNLHYSRPANPPVDHSPVSIQTENWDEDGDDENEQPEKSQDHRRLRLARGGEKSQTQHRTNCTRDPHPGFIAKKAGHVICPSG